MVSILGAIVAQVTCHILASPPPMPPLQIAFESRLGMHDLLNGCAMTIIGTNFKIQQKGATARGNAFASHKYAGKLAICNKFGVSIFAENLVWIQGPYLAGKWMDIKIFNIVFCHYLEPEEQVKADIEKT